MGLLAVLMPVSAGELDPDDAMIASSLIESMGGLSADESPRVSVDERGVVTHVAAPQGRAMAIAGVSPEDGKEQRVLAFVETHAEALGIASDRVGLNVHAITTTPERSYVRIRQQYDGIPVHGAEIVMQLQPDGSVKSFLSDIMTDTAAFDSDPSATVPGLDRAAASEFALAAANRLLENARKDYEADIAFALESGEIDADTAQEHLARASASVVELKDDGELVIYAPYVVGDEGENALTWAFKTHDSAGIMLPVQVFVAANSGDIAYLNPLGAHAVDRRVYDNHLNGQDGLPNATLRRTETSGPVTIFDTIFFADFNAHFDILGYIYDYFDDHHGWDGPDGVGGPIVTYMRYDTVYNAYSNWIEGYMWFGTYGWGVSDDMVGHEYTHAVVYNVSELEYWRQAGAIAESLADMWGEFVDWTCPVVGNDLAAQKWEIAETVAGGPIRDMKNPPAYSHPDKYQGTYWYFWQSGMTYEEKLVANDIFVHTNSGVGNKLAYLLTDGDTFNGNFVSGMGVAIVRDLYWEAVQLMGTSPNYSDFHDLLLDAADNLGLTTAQINNIQTACEAVEID
jgi:Zn-dependent metalloprotease